MDMCICGHLEHSRTGECRAAGCRCKHFKPEIRLLSASLPRAILNPRGAPGTVPA